MKVIVYTDGAALGNPGPGGFGVVMKYGKHRKEIAQGFRKTTNNRMELLAVIVALEALKKDGVEVLIYTDSKYVQQAVTQGWLFNWEKKGFKDKKNPDLWIRFLRVYRKHRVSLQWVKGHAGIPENERCDLLATTAAKQAPDHIDEAYELSKN
ncbi:MAG: ribonuclease HI [Bacteroidia bacterium]|nr:ribonuclease HI [Bacteroidia bacterium]